MKKFDTKVIEKLRIETEKLDSIATLMYKYIDKCQDQSFELMYPLFLSLIKSCDILGNCNHRYPEVEEYAKKLGI